jgi:hypothetical protein
MRRRLRERRREREARLLDLGALVYELHRQGKRAPELLQEKAAELALLDEEVRELEAALDGDGAGAAASEVEQPGDDAHDAYDAGEAHEGDDAAIHEADDDDAIHAGADEAIHAGDDETIPEGDGDAHEADDDAATHEADALDAEPEHEADEGVLDHDGGPEDDRDPSERPE